MKLTISRRDLANAAKTVSAASGGTLTVLHNALIETDGGGVTLTATNLDLTIRARLSAEVREPGVLTAPIKLLADVVAKLSGPTVTAEREGDQLVLRAGRSRFALPTTPVDEWPADIIPEYEGESWALAAECFERIAQVTFAASTEHTRPTLNGIHLSRDGDSLRVVATNGHRLVRMVIPDAGASLPEDGLIVPATAIAKAARILAGQEVRVQTTDSKIRFAGEGIEVHARLIEGPYPENEQLWPTEHAARLTVERPALVSALERIGLANHADETRRSAFRLNGSLTVSAGGDGAKGVEEVVADGEGEMLIGFNSEYVRECASFFGADELEWIWTSPERPSVLSAADDDSARVLLMPLRLMGDE